MAYALIGLTLILIYGAFRKRLPWSLLAGCMAALYIAVQPFLYVQLFVGNFFRDILSNYGMAGASQHAVIPIHFKEPAIFFKTLTELMTFLDVQHRWAPFLFPTLLLAAAPAAALAARAMDRHTGVLLLWTYLTLAISFCSPVASYIQGHFAGFLILYLAVLARSLDAPSVPQRWIARACVLVLVVFSSCWLPAIRHNQYDEVSWLPEYIRQERIATVCISDGAHLVLKHTPFLQGAQFPVFICKDTETIRTALAQDPDQRLVIATLDCDVAGALSQMGRTIVQEYKILTLLESHLANGIAFYFVEPGQKK
jgi:hypothetical protein